MVKLCVSLKQEQNLRHTAVLPEPDPILRAALHRPPLEISSPYQSITILYDEHFTDQNKSPALIGPDGSVQACHFLSGCLGASLVVRCTPKAACLPSDLPLRHLPWRFLCEFWHSMCRNTSFNSTWISGFSRVTQEAISKTMAQIALVFTCRQQMTCVMQYISVCTLYLVWTSCSALNGWISRKLSSMRIIVLQENCLFLGCFDILCIFIYHRGICRTAFI